MIIKRLTRHEFDEYRQSAVKGFQILECQPYGQPNEQFYIVAVTQGFHLEMPLGEIIADKGRTSGLYQNKGATGVLHPESAALHLTPNAAGIVRDLPNGRIDVEGESWKEILTNIAEIANINLSDFINAQVKSTVKSKKKIKPSGQSVR